MLHVLCFMKMIIPAINVYSKKEAEEKIQKVFGLSDWLHIDVSDGIIGKPKNWAEPFAFKKLAKNIKREVHLMVENPEKEVDSWILAGVKRAIVHIETIADFQLLFTKCLGGFVEFGLALNPDTPVSEIEAYLDKIKFVLILGVIPGLSGQKFNEKVLEKIKYLKQNYPEVLIEVDGGVNLETAPKIKQAGADILAVGSYLFSGEPKDRMKELENVIK